jgi:hypothetical protein
MPAVTFGATDRLELGAAASVTVPASAETPRELLAHARFKWLDTGSRFAVVSGAWHQPMSHRSGADAYGVVVATVSQAVAAKRSATLSAGIYTLVGRQAPDESRLGMIFGWDQALSSRWSFSLEWTTGNNWYGYLSSSLTFATDSQWMTAGYCVGNQSVANHGPCVSFGRTF